MRSVLLLALLVCSQVIGSPVGEKRVLNFLILDDVRSACSEGCDLVGKYPQSQECWEAYLQALAKKGDSREMLQAWNGFIERFPERASDRLLLESMAWGVIEKDSSSHSPIVRSYALIGALYGQDARGVRIIEKGLNDTNVAVRSLALKLSAFLRDDYLQNEVFRLLKEDNHLQVRLGAIEAAGRMKMTRAQRLLLKILQSSRSRAEEKLVAIQALVSIYDQLSVSQVRALVNSKRAALRELACRVVLHAEMEEAVPVITPLLRDSSPDVRAAALQTVGYLREDATPDLIDQVRELSNDPNPMTAISASWALMFFSSEEGYAALEKYLKGNNRDHRLLAGAALTATGQYGRQFLTPAFDSADDPYLKMNVALGLIVNEERVEESCEALVEGFVAENEQWMWKQEGIFRVLAPSDVKHVPWIPNHPEMVNQMTRLEILNVLAIKESPDAVEAAKSLLSRRQWGISGMASSLLLQEGDESAIELVQSLVNDPSPKVRIQAALVLAMWGGDDSSVHILQESYDKADRETKERILEGLGSVGSKRSLAFLTQRLGDPQPTLRVIAAAALLQCLYH